MKKRFYLLLFLIYINFQQSLNASENFIYHPKYEPEQIIICFDEFSFTLNKEAIEKLISIQNRFDSLVSLNSYFKEYSKMELFPFNSEMEYKFDNLIAFKRANAIVEFLDNKCNFDKKNCSIILLEKFKSNMQENCSGVILTRVRNCK